MRLETLSLTDIQPHPRNIRRTLGDLDELAASIKAQGLVQPLIVAPHGTGFVLIAGHRRHAAAAKAGLASVQALVRDDLKNDAEVIEAMLVENLQRSDLTVLEEADAYEQLALLGVKDAAMAKATGRSAKTIKERRLVAALPTERRTQYEKGQLSLDGAIECGRLREKHADDPEILAVIDKASTWKFGSSYGVKDEIRRILDARKQPEPPKPSGVVVDFGDDDHENTPPSLHAGDNHWAQRDAMAQRQREWITANLLEAVYKDPAGALRLYVADTIDLDGVHELHTAAGLREIGDQDEAAYVAEVLGDANLGQLIAYLVAMTAMPYNILQTASVLHALGREIPEDEANA